MSINESSKKLIDTLGTKTEQKTQKIYKTYEDTKYYKRALEPIENFIKKSIIHYKINEADQLEKDFLTIQTKILKNIEHYKTYGKFLKSSVSFVNLYNKLINFKNAGVFETIEEPPFTKTTIKNIELDDYIPTEFKRKLNTKKHLKDTVEVFKYKDKQSLLKAEETKNLLLKRVDSYLKSKEHFEVKEISQLKELYKKKYKQKNIKRLEYLRDELSGIKYKKGDLKGEYVFDLSNYYEFFEISKNDKFIITNEEYLNSTYLKKQDAQYAQRVYSKAKYIEEVNNDKLIVFLTLTIPSKYHYYKQKHPTTTDKKKKHIFIKNEKCKFKTLGEAVDAGYEYINYLKRRLYKTFKDRLIKEDIEPPFDFISVIEQHKNMQVHNHQITYLTEEQQEIFEDVFKNFVKKHKLKKTDYQIIESAAGSSYVMKYISKSLDGLLESNENDHFKHYYRKKIISMSNYKHTTQGVINRVYSYLKREKSELFEEMKNKIARSKEVRTKEGEIIIVEQKLSLYYQIEQYILNNLVVITEEEEVERKKPFKKLIDKEFSNLWEKKYHFNSVGFGGCYSDDDMVEEIVSNISLKYGYDYINQTQTVKIKKVVEIFEKEPDPITGEVFMVYEAGQTETTDDNFNRQLKEMSFLEI